MSMALSSQEKEKREKFLQIKRFAQTMQHIFPSGTGAHGRLKGWALDDQTKLPKVGSKQQNTANRSAEVKDYVYHLIKKQSDGPFGIAAYPLNYVSRTIGFIVIDIDEDTPRARQAVMQTCHLIKSRGGHPYTERTTQNRWHIWYIPTSPIPIPLSKYIAKALSQPSKAMRIPVETYPATFPDNPMQPRIGKYMNLPYRGALYSYYTGKPSDYEHTGKTFLVDPYNLDEYESEDDENEDGIPIFIFDLANIHKNNMKVSEQLADFGRQVMVNEEKEEGRKRKNRRRQTGEKEPTISFNTVLEKLSARSPRIGERHSCILACAGVACRQGISEGEAIDGIVNCVNTWNRPGERRDWRSEVTRAVESTYMNATSGSITGIPTLIRMGVI